jgi:hypothetical protein
VNNEFEMLQKEVKVAYFDVLSRNFPGRIEEKLKKP